MTFNEKIKYFFKKYTGLSLYKNLPIGLDALENVKRKLKHHNFQTFVDVGANVGQTARQIRHHFPDADIYCIEPFKDTFYQLQQQTKGLGLSYHNLALGASSEALQVQVAAQSDQSDRNSLLQNNLDAAAALKTEEVQVVTLSHFCRTNNISFIDYLKIDTEGYDLEVLKGADDMLRSASVALVEAELSMNPGNTFHVDFVCVKNYLEDLGYTVFGIYEQVQELRNKVPVLRRANVLFISEKLKI